MDIAGMIEPLMPVIMALVLIIIPLKWIMNWKEKRDDKEEVEKPRNESDRLYIAKKKACKMSNLLKGVPVKTTGDESTPPTKIGETCAGIVPGNDEVVMFLKKRWWHFWEDPICLRVEPEFVGDMNTGEIILKGKALDPVSDRYMYIVPPSQYHDEVNLAKVYKRRSRVSALEFKRLLNMDIDEDRSYVVKTAMRGSGKRAFKEVYMPSEPPTEKKDKVEREKKRKAEEMQNELERDRSRQKQSQGQGMLEGGV